jgi:hypothetical protein
MIAPRVSAGDLASTPGPQQTMQMIGANQSESAYAPHRLLRHLASGGDSG